MKGAAGGVATAQVRSPIGMLPNVQLAPIFYDGSICTFDAYSLRTIVTPPRTISRGEFSTQLSAMSERELRLRLDGAVYTFVETRGSIRYVAPEAMQKTVTLERCEPSRTVAIRRIVTKRALTLLLVDEVLGKALVVIGSHALHVEPDGLTVKFETEDGKQMHEI